MRQHVDRAAYQPRPSFAELAHASAPLGGIYFGAHRRLEHRLVGPCAERRPFAGHDQHAAIAIVADGMKMTLEVEDDGLVETVAPLVPIKSDRGKQAVVFDKEVLCHQLGSSVAEPTTREPPITIVRIINELAILEELCILAASRIA